MRRTMPIFRPSCNRSVKQPFRRRRDQRPKYHHQPELKLENRRTWGTKIPTRSKSYQLRLGSGFARLEHMGDTGLADWERSRVPTELGELPRRRRESSIHISNIP